MMQNIAILKQHVQQSLLDAGLPNIYKNNVPLRPILSAIIDSPCYKLAKYSKQTQ